MKYFGITDKGIVRKDNQDTFSIRYLDKQKLLVVALCDGMGGQNAGALASDLSIHTFMDGIISKLTSRIKKYPDVFDALRLSCEEANMLAYDYSLFDNSFSGMGSTLVGAVISENGYASIINVGDSRCYILNDEGISQITVDHSLVEDLIRSGAITKEEAKSHQQKSTITRAVGSEETVKPDFFEANLNKGDMLILCSDGLSNYVTDQDMYETFLHIKDPEKICKVLLNETYENGAGDNVTIISVVI